MNRLPGKIELKIEGNQIEKLLTHALSKGIIFRNINRLAYNCISVTVKYTQYSQVKEICEENKFSLTVIKKKGIASIIKKLQNKRGFLVGFIVFILSITYMNMHVWTIEISGVTNQKEEQISDDLMKREIKKGRLKAEIDTDQLEREILEKYKEISWVGVSFKGTVLRVELNEATLEPKILDLSKPCEIVSNKHGVITNINVFRGEALVEEGQQVFVDDLLVSGILKHEEHDTIEFVHAQAIIEARVWYEKNYCYQYRELISNTTGNTVEGWQLIWNDKQFDFKKNNEIESYIEVEKEKVKLPLFEDLILKKVEKVEVEEMPKDITQDEIVSIASKKAFNQAVKELNVEGKVIDKKYRYDIIENNSITVSIYLETREKIGVERLIDTVGGNE